MASKRFTFPIVANILLGVLCCWTPSLGEAFAPQRIPVSKPWQTVREEYGAEIPLHTRKSRRQSPINSLLTTSRTRTAIGARRRSIFEFWSDDARRFRRLQRRAYRRASLFTQIPTRTVLMGIHLMGFVLQTLDVTLHFKGLYPQLWPGEAVPFLFDVLLGRAQLGPITTDFVMTPLLLGRRKVQPHRYLTYGLLHGSIIHLLVNMYFLMNEFPSWVGGVGDGVEIGGDGGLRGQLVWSTYSTGIVAASWWWGRGNYGTRKILMGASGGIMALLGLYFCQLRKMKTNNADRATIAVVRNVALIFGMGTLVETVGNGAHWAGLVAGYVMGFLFGPSYKGNYGMRRKNSIAYDGPSSDYKLSRGFGKTEGKALFPLWVFWVAVAIFIATNPSRRAIPFSLLKSFREPGSLSMAYV